MGLARIFGVCAALLFASSVTAATTIDLGPSDYRNWGTGSNSHSPSGLRSSTGQTVRLPPLNGNLNVTRNAVIPYGSIANGMRNFVRINPASIAASAAVTGLFLAVDWVFDQDSGEWRKWGGEELTDPELTLWHGQISKYPRLYAPTPTDLCEGLSAQQGYPLSRIELRNNGTSVTCYVDYHGTVIPQGIGQTDANCPTGYDFSPSLGVCIGDPQLINLDPSDWNELAGYLPSANANDVADAGRDTQRMIGNPLPGYQDQAITGPSSVSGGETTSTSVDPVTGDTVVTTTQTTTNIQYGDTTITTTNTTTSTTYQNGTETSTTTTTETPGELPVSVGTGSAEWPGFCDWASVVCDWLDWTMEDPGLEDPELPVPIDDDFYRDKSISFGSKSCPPDYEITVPFINTTVAVPMQPFCDFAGMIYFMVMASAYIYAAYISVGVSRNG